ncbi:flagellar basal body M-ring protein FliF [Corallincola holothuriorum]|uniref:Flagellar M-ring protein n=1 Tax=Corallincola holothuriorum TaxID=2282215 RepID=A0A368N4U1_9GAMM|nr:flagellar basal-body MS-ring/collar protein FliF [Corallincola holothuriorum]RCU44571.1 flagellar basal body M-ring protein FliF [Corallincola holothuriorum]
MAEATQNTELMVPAAGGEMSKDAQVDSGEKKSSVLAHIGNVDVLRQITIILALAICLALAVFVLIWAQEPEMRPLPQMESDELLQTLDFFDQNKITYKLERDVLSIPAEEYQDIKLKLARAGLEATPENGTDILMQDMGFGVSQRLERERLKHSREQQIARTLEDLRNVKKARVLLAIPQQSVFARREKSPSATVVLTIGRGSALSREEIDSVVDIVSSAVNGMEPTRVTVTDQSGRLLNSGSQDASSARSRKEYDLERQREAEYMNKIDSILIPVVGLGNYTAQVDVSMDFTTVEQTQRRYNPDLPALRSEMTVEDNSVGGVLGGIPGALTNQPPVAAEIPEEAIGGGPAGGAAPGRSHREATRNYELDTTLSHTRQQVGVVRRVSVSVAVNYKSVANADGSGIDLVPRAQQELANLRRLLQGGVGFDVQRGDSLEVVTIPFVRTDDLVELEVPFYEMPMFWSGMRLLSGILIVLILVLLVVRPMIRKLTASDDGVADEDRSLLEGAVSRGIEGGLLAAENELDSEVNEELIGSIVGGKVQLPDLHKEEDVLKAVRALVANEPDLSVQVVKGWLEQEANKK